jgi:hypothetical protein
VPTVVVSRPVLWEVADILEQIFRIACTENLHPRVEDFETARRDYQAAHGLTNTSMREGLGLKASREILERAQEIVLMRFYEKRWRVWDSEGRRVNLSRQPKPEKPPRAKSPPKRKGRPPKRAPEAPWDTPEDTRTINR